jgi:hypothetical protein
MAFVSWDDDIPNIWKNKIHVPNHQPEYVSEYQNLSLMICVSYVDHLLTCYASLRIITHHYVASGIDQLYTSKGASPPGRTERNWW